MPPKPDTVRASTSKARAIVAARSHGAATPRPSGTAAKASPRVGGDPATVTRILGIDPGTRLIGYGIVDVRGAARDSGFDYIECGVISVRPEIDLPTRLHEVANNLVEIIAEFAPQALAIEKAFAGRNAATALKLGQARGAIMLVAAQHGLGIAEYAPSQIKQAVTGHGRATKHEIQQRVQLLCRLRHAPTADAADALAIALCHARTTPIRGSGHLRLHR